MHSSHRVVIQLVVEQRLILWLKMPLVGSLITVSISRYSFISLDRKIAIAID